MQLLCFFGHHRGATTWTSNIIQTICREMGWKYVVVHNPDYFERNLRGFVQEQEVDFLTYSNADFEYVRDLRDFRGFHVVRDPRDIVVSTYFSHLYSHPTREWPALAEHRKELQALSKNRGLLLELECRRQQFEEMYNWDYSLPNVQEIKMEELTRDPHTVLVEIVEFLGMLENDPVRPGTRIAFSTFGTMNRVIWKGQALGRRLFSPKIARKPLGRKLTRIPVQRLRAIISKHDFAKKSGGRRPGQEDVRHHYRKGIPGDWKNHFTEEHIRAFKENYNELLVKLGYESGYDW